MLDITQLSGKQAILMEYIPGATIGGLISRNPDQREYYLDISIDIQQKIHQYEGPTIELMSSKLKRQIEHDPNLNMNLKAKLLDKLDSMPFESRLCHGDYHIYNVIISDNRASIIDWVNASVGNIRANVCRTYLLYTQFSRKMADMYLNIYFKKSRLSKAEILEWAPIIAAARLSESVPQTGAIVQ